MFNVLARLMKVDPSFVTNRSCSKGRDCCVIKPCTRDARVIHLSLADKVSKRFAIIAAEQEKLDWFVFRDLAGQEVGKLGNRPSAIRRRLQKAAWQTN